MSKQIMNDNFNILDNPELKKNPFSLPDGYFAKMEDEVRASINTPKHQRNIYSYLKPALGLVCSFALIYGIAFGVLSLTNSLSEETSDSIELIEKGYLDNSFIDHIDDYLAISQEEGLDQEDTKLEEEEIVSFLSDELTPAQLSLIYADGIK